ncbi:MAG: hypothetical protein ACOX35_05835 [Bacillota bacterium]|nr:hypothetical protein [Candidatus Fermentithermobacillaceae bacterium]
MKTWRRLIDSGWRVTIPKPIRNSLGWKIGTEVCVHWDGFEITICCPKMGCVKCPDISRVGALGKVLIPPRVREEARLYPGQVLSFSLQGNQIMVRPEEQQFRCSACGSECEVRQVLPNVHLCKLCRENLEAAALKSVRGAEYRALQGK